MGGPHILAHISPEGQHQVNNNRGAHGQERSIDKILPDLAGGNTHPVADGRTNAKGIPLNKAFKFVHKSKVIKFEQTCEPGVIQIGDFRTFTQIFVTAALLKNGPTARLRQGFGGQAD